MLKFILSLMITGPIQKLREGAIIIGNGNLDHNIRFKSRDELKDLAEEFNLMAGKLKDLDRMKDDFISSVSHDLRSPLTAIRAHAQSLFNGSTTLSEKQQENLAIIINNTVRLNRFIGDMPLKFTARSYRLQYRDDEIYEHPGTFMRFRVITVIESDLSPVVMNCELDITLHNVDRKRSIIVQFSKKNFSNVRSLGTLKRDVYMILYLIQLIITRSSIIRSYIF